MSRLRPWVGGSNPQAAALKDEGAFLVESVRAHRNGSRRSRGDLEFHIKWVGYDLEETDWHPWNKFYANAVVHQYLRDNHMATLIPKRFRPSLD